MAFGLNIRRQGDARLVTRPFTLTRVVARSFVCVQLPALPARYAACRHRSTSSHSVGRYEIPFPRTPKVTLSLKVFEAMALVFRFCFYGCINFSLRYTPGFADSGR
jgi:hypothetical protein